MQLVFYGNEAVQNSYRTYIESLNQPTPAVPAESAALTERRRDLLFNLLHDIGADLEMKFDRRELERLSYSPQGWANDEAAGRTARDYFIQVVTGQRAFHVAPFGGVDPKYPPPPQVSPPQPPPPGA